MQKSSEKEKSLDRDRENIAKMAYSGKEAPADPLGRALYYMMQRVYELHKRGDLAEDDGVYLKGRVLGFDSLNEPERQNLLDNFIKSWSKDGPEKYKTEIKAVSAILTTDEKQNCGTVARREVCPVTKGFCREDCGLYDCEKNQCAVLSIVEVLEDLKGAFCHE